MSDYIAMYDKKRKEMVWPKIKKTSISDANSYQAIGEFWDNHDLGDYWDNTKPAEFKISIGSVRRYYGPSGAFLLLC